MKNILFLLLLTASFTCLCQNSEITQSKLDSILEDPTKYDLKVYDIRDLMNKNKSLKGWSSLYSKLSQYKQFTEKEPDSALYFANKAIFIYNDSQEKRITDDKQIMRAYYTKGRILHDRKDYYASTLNQFKAIKIAEKFNYKWIGYYYIAIASNHLKMGNDSIALNYYLDAEKDNVFMSVPRAAISTCNRIGKLYVSLDNDEMAKLYYNKGVDISLESKNINNLGPLYGSIGEIFYSKRKMDSVLHYYKKSIIAYTNTPPESDPFHTEYRSVYNSYVNIYENRNIRLEISKLKLLINELDSTDKVNEEVAEVILMSHRALGLAYSKLGNAKEYENLLQESKIVLAKLYRQQLDENLANLEIQYRSNEKDASILKLRESEQQKNTIINQQKFIGLVSGILFLVLIVLLYLFYKQRQLRNKYKNVSLEQRLLCSQLNPHFVFNSIDSAMNLVTEDPKQSIPYLSKFSNLFRLILKNSRQEFISLDDELITIQDYLELQSNFSRKFKFSITLENGIDRESVFIPPMFIQPFIENSIKHGFKGEENESIDIQMNLNKTKKILECTIKDNGIGYSSKIRENQKEKTTESFSGKILQERLDIYASTFKVDAKYIINDLDPISGGTVVTIALPYILET